MASHVELLIFDGDGGLTPVEAISHSGGSGGQPAGASSG
jgi:hypothetical protein